MNTVRVLRIYHSAVVDEFRQREALLKHRYGYDMHVICPPVWAEGGRPVRPGNSTDVPLHVVDVYGRRHPNLFWYEPSALRRVLREVKPHILDLHEEPCSLAVGGALRAAKSDAPGAKICVYTAQNLPKRYPPPFTWLEKRALAAASAAYPCSTAAGDVLRLKGFRGSLHVVPLGVTMPPRVRRAPGAPRVGFVGRLESYKGGVIAVNAFARASVGSDATLDIVGAGPQHAELKRLVTEKGIESRVRFWGALPQEETLRRIAELDVLLVPSLTTASWKEQFGRVAAQALAAGTAVIASDSGSLREVVAEAGILVPEGDIPACASALQELLLDPGAREQLADRARRRAAAFLSWDYVAERIDQMYRLVLHGS